MKKGLGDLKDCGQKKKRKEKDFELFSDARRDHQVQKTLKRVFLLCLSSRLSLFPYLLTSSILFYCRSLFFTPREKRFLAAK